MILLSFVNHKMFSHENRIKDPFPEYDVYVSKRENLNGGGVTVKFSISSFI